MLTVSLITLGDPGTMTGGYLYHQRVAARAAANDARMGFVSVPDRPFLLRVAAGRGRLRATVRGRPDVVVIDSIAAAYIGPWLAALRNHPPLVGMLHQPPGGIDSRGLRMEVQAALDRCAYRAARRLLVASVALADQLRAAGVPESRLRVVQPGREAAQTALPPGRELRRGRRMALLSVGNWVPRKGLLDLLDAVARLPPDAATLHLVGDPDAEPAYGNRVRARLAAVDLAGRVVVHGAQPPEQVAGFYPAADVFALTSGREPYGTVYGEAMAAGLPVVGWRAGNLPHLATDGLEGFAVPHGDLPALAAVLLRLANDETLRQRMGAAAHRRAAGYPTWEETAARFFAELRAVAWAAVDP